MLLLLFLMITADDGFEKAELDWRAEREMSMKKEDSWLNLIGLYWLKEGRNDFGTGDEVDLVLPKHATVAKAGAFYLENGQVRYEMARGQRGMLDGETKPKGILKFNSVLAHNHLRFLVIERGDRLALRVRDLRAPKFLDFKALDFYKPDEGYRIEATFEPYDEPLKMKILTVVDTELELLVPGVIKFELQGRQFELLPTLTTLEDDEYFINFKDQTSGSTTYGAGRFLYAPRPVDGKIILDFNRAINPPCAYTDFATCPLPPGENWLSIAIEAGERTYPDKDELETTP